MYEEMTKVKECFDKYGGHPMAAGLSMQEDRIEELRTKLNDNTNLTEKDFIEKVQIDIALPIEVLSEPLIKEFDQLEPFGTENPKPLFAQKNMVIAGIRELGKNGRVLKFFLRDSLGQTIEAVWFGEIAEFYQDVEALVGARGLSFMKKGQPHQVIMDCTYYPQINEWRGRRTIQIVIKNYRLKLL
jgi:single-stranded-DNA-specific exonuclease